MTICDVIRPILGSRSVFLLMHFAQNLGNCFEFFIFENPVKDEEKILKMRPQLCINPPPLTERRQTVCLQYPSLPRGKNAWLPTTFYC